MHGDGLLRRLSQTVNRAHVELSVASLARWNDGHTLIVCMLRVSHSCSSLYFDVGGWVGAGGVVNATRLLGGALELVRLVLVLSDGRGWSCLLLHLTVLLHFALIIELRRVELLACICVDFFSRRVDLSVLVSDARL